MTPRGIRNNNPGNIRHSKDKWQGKTKHQPDNAFVRFESPEWGIRAMARILIRYQDHHGIDTIRGIVKRWAPPVENDTGAYIDAVAKRTGIASDKRIDLHSYETLRPIVIALIWHENGQQPYDDATIDKGLALAGVTKPLKAVSESRTIKGQKVATAGILGTGAAELGKDLLAQTDTLTAVLPYLDAAKWVLLLIVLAGIGFTIYARLDDQEKRIT